jgi:hypothetical protein
LPAQSCKAQNNLGWVKGFCCPCSAMPAVLRLPFRSARTSRYSTVHWTVSLNARALSGSNPTTVSRKHTSFVYHTNLL